MRILSIETSCDETAVSIIDGAGTLGRPNFKVLGNALYSQVKLHAKYGGVFPNLAKREHARNLPPLLEKALREAGLWKLAKESQNKHLGKVENSVVKILKKEFGLAENLLSIVSKIKKPKIDAIGVTQGPGLEPALWVGISFARALGVLWKMPVIPINHMEGHIVSPLFQKKKVLLSFPALALLISGGHTELVYVHKSLNYSVIGKTRDDALGEAYDKVARMLGLPYPGGPEISKLASEKREEEGKENKWNLPRPMIYSKDFDFSFSGLKTSVLYKIKDKKITKKLRQEIAYEFEEAVTEVIITKTKRAIEKFKPRSLIVGGGVIANRHIRKQFEILADMFPKLKLHIPSHELSTDNSVMIGIAAYLRIKKFKKLLKLGKAFNAKGNLSL